MSDPITRLNTALEGRYRIEREIGHGGMATVYLADDLKHERQVALKVLKPELAAVVGADRFLAEIKTTANLQHPHILPLHDSGEADGFLFYVMPFIEGETLRDRLARERQLPVGEAVRLATDVAEALHTAHEQGVIHRDVKPANILLSRGRPLVADFGIALAVSAAGGGRLTETGLSMGTPYYMSPEQASADRDPSPASDVYSLGCVLYEMLVGEPPYAGGSAQAVLAKILTEEARAPTRVRASIPPNIDAAIRKALEKLPADRFATAQEFGRALADPGFRYGEAAGVAAAAGVGPWKVLSGVLGLLFAVAAGVQAWSALHADPPPVERFELDLHVGEFPDLTPDGSATVFIAPAAGDAGSQQLWIRRWTTLDPTPISGTEGLDLETPVVSPDGADVAYVAAGELKVAPLGGGLVRTVADSAICCQRWGPDGVIYYPRADFTEIRSISASGGAPQTVLRIDEDSGEQLGYFQVVPGGKSAVFTVWEVAGDARIEAIRLADGERAVLTPGARPYVTTGGRLVFGGLDGQIYGAPFDADALELTGPAVPFVEGVFVIEADPTYTLSASGTLLYLTGGSGGGGLEFVWVDRSGRATSVDPGHTITLPTNHGWRLSPDGTRIAFNSVVAGSNDIRIKVLPDGPEERITFSDDDDMRPFWSPDGRHVTYFSGPGPAELGVWSRRADGTGEPELILDADRSFSQGSWSADGAVLALRAAATAGMGLGQRDVLSFRVGVDSAPRPLVATPDFVEGSPFISPDARWLAYTSNGTGRDEVYVRPFPNVDSTRVRVSTNGGIAPVWARDGGELFFVDEGRNMVSARFDGDGGRVLEQQILFTIPGGYALQAANNFYDVSPDGARFLMVRPYTGGTEEADPPGFVLVRNFIEEMRRLQRD